jgi:ESCRT-II complex subunit VPS25
VRAKQLHEWCNIIVKWHEERKATTMAVADWPLWENTAIDRRLNAAGVAAVMQHLVEVDRCEWIDGAKTSARIFYKTPAEWAVAILAYIHDNGMDGTLFVLYDLVQGDTTLDARESPATPRARRLAAVAHA